MSMPRRVLEALDGSGRPTRWRPHHLGGQRERGGARGRRAGAARQSRRRRWTRPAARSARVRSLGAAWACPRPTAQRVRSLDELFAAADHVGFPAVVKPEFGASRGGVRPGRRLRGSAEGVHARPRCRWARAPTKSSASGNDLLLEEYLDGVEFDVDLVMQDGRVPCSPACPRTGRRPSRRSRRPDCTARRTTAGKAVGRLVDFAVRDGAGLRVHAGASCTSRASAPVTARASSR